MHTSDAGTFQLATATGVPHQLSIYCLHRFTRRITYSFTPPSCERRLHFPVSPFHSRKAFGETVKPVKTRSHHAKILRIKELRIVNTSETYFYETSVECILYRRIFIRTHVPHQTSRRFLKTCRRFTLNALTFF